MKPLDVIKHNLNITKEFIDSDDLEKANTMIELVCLQIKILRNKEPYCKLNQEKLTALQKIENEKIAKYFEGYFNYLNNERPIN